VGATVTSAPTTFADIATAYARDVVDGKIVACKWHRLACQRHLNDLARAEAGDFSYVWNPDLEDANGKPYRPAERICKFAELMPHIKGDWAAKGQLIKLEAWQIFILASIFGLSPAARSRVTPSDNRQSQLFEEGTQDQWAQL